MREKMINEIEADWNKDLRKRQRMARREYLKANHEAMVNTFG